MIRVKLVAKVVVRIHSAKQEPRADHLGTQVDAGISIKIANRLDYDVANQDERQPD
jgi:hypothetical protein